MNRVSFETLPELLKILTKINHVYHMKLENDPQLIDVYVCLKQSFPDAELAEQLINKHNLLYFMSQL